MAGNNTEKSEKKARLKQYIFVIRQLASREIKRGNTSKMLGQMWNILTPFISMLTMAVLFAFVFHRDIVTYMPYVFTGTIVYGFFNSGMNGCMHSLSGNKNLLIRTKIPKNLLTIEKVYVALIHMAFSLVGYVAILIITGTRVGPAVALAPVGIVFAIFIILGIGKILAVINLYFADISYFYQVIMRLVFYGSALFYEADRLSPVVQKVVGFNPIFLTITFERSCILYNQIPEPMIWIKLIIYAVVIYLIGTAVFNKGSQDAVAKL